MKFILIDGGPASGKNTLGKLLVDDFNKHAKKAVLLDLDSYVEKFCPTWVWDNENKKANDLSKARTDFCEDIDKFIQENFIVIAIGDRFLTKDEVLTYTNKLTDKVPVLLYHLNAPFVLREQRLYQRGPHSLIDLKQDQKDRDEVTDWPGYVYENINSSDADATELIKLIESNKGLINII